MAQDARRDLPTLVLPADRSFLRKGRPVLSAVLEESDRRRLSFSNKAS